MTETFKVKEVSCIVDKDNVSLEDVYKFTVAVNSHCKAQDYIDNFRQVKHSGMTEWVQADILLVGNRQIRWPSLTLGD